MKKNKSISNINGLMRYCHKTLGINFHHKSISKPAKHKSYAPYVAIRAVFMSLFMGKNSARSIEACIEMIASKLSRSSFSCRSTMCDLLNEERVGIFLNDMLWQMFLSAVRLRVHKPEWSRGKIVVTLDAIDTGEIHSGHSKCGLCLPRVRDGVTHYFHKSVVLSLCTEHGSVPFAVRYVKPAEIEHLSEGVSKEKFKAECELTASKALLKEISDRCGGTLPFDVLVGDALFANAPFMEKLEGYGSGGIFAYKQENRLLYKAAKKDFNGASFGFDIDSVEWISQENNRSYEAKSGVYTDHNRVGENKSVKVHQITRHQKDGDYTVMAISTNADFADARFVENSRVARWRDHENGIFNTLTNGWQVAKHIFFHKTYAMQAMMAMILICLGASNLYLKGNLSRGGRKFSGTIRDFFDQNIASFYSMKAKRLLALLHHPPPATV